MKWSLLLAAILLCVCAKPDLLIIGQSLSRGEATDRLTFNVKQACEMQVELLARADTDWGEIENESATLLVRCAGKTKLDSQDVVLFMGRKLFPYRFSLGYLPAGSYTLQISFDRNKSRPNAKTVFLQSLSLFAKTTTNSDYDAYRFSPVLYARGMENTHSDVPLLMYYERKAAQDSLKEIAYTVVFSNEDGGTDTEGLLQNWGRTADIEWLYSAFLDKEGKFVKGRFQGRHHDEMFYTGPFVDQHAVLNICTSNNMARQDTISELKFCLTPLIELPSKGTRERAMDLYPFVYEIADKEMRREGKYELTANPLTHQASDIRNYLMIDIDFAANGKGLRNLMPAVCLVEDTNVWYSADHHLMKKGPSDRSPRRMTIELPPGTDLSQLASLKFMNPQFADSASYLEVRAIQQIAMLAQNYQLLVHPFSWSGPARVINQSSAKEIRFALRPKPS